MTAVDRSRRTNPIEREEFAGGRFAIGADRRIIEWDEAAARLLGVSSGEALGIHCDRVIGGKNDFDHAICGPACTAWKALAAGSISGASKVLVRMADGARRRLACDLIALPGGGALGSLRRADDAAADLAGDLAGIAALTARASGESLQQGLRHALDFLLERTGADAGEAFLAEPHGKGVMRTCHRGRFRRSFDQVLHFDRGEGFPGFVLAHGQPIYTDHLAEDPRFLRTQVTREGFRAYLCNPLTSGDDAFGCIALAFRRPDVDLERVLNLLRWVSTPMGLVVDRALAHLREAATLPLHGVEVDPEHRLPRALQALLQEMVGVSHADGGELYLPCGDTELRWLVPGVGTVPRCPALSVGAIGRCPAFETGTTGILHGRQNSWPPGCRDVPHPGGAWCCIPMSCDGELLGVVRLLFRHLRPSPPNESIALLEAVASLAAEKVRDVRDQLARAPHAGAPLRAWRQRNADTGERHGEARLEIRCFGSLELLVDGARVAPAAIRRRRVLTLLGILLMHHDQPQCKDVLIEMLWPGADPGVRKGQFHVLVHELRKLLEPDSRGNWLYVRNQADRYVFDTRTPCWIDMLQFQTQFELGRKAEAVRDKQAAINAYEAAAELYRGDYLQDEPFDERCWQLREQLRETCLGLLNRLSALWGTLERWDRSVAWSRRALLVDPLREEVHRALMYALWASGRRDEAVRQYEACAHLLRERLDLAPLPETQQLFALIRATPRPHPGH
ncbi:MAG: GAF domain-containing protein [Burkholderiales bacterium]|nr:GAF domain-containing protein [Burkholderiales bacterium]